MENHLIYYLETYTSSEIIAQTTTFTILVVVPASLFRNIPLFPFQTVLITDAKVIYYIDTAIRANTEKVKDFSNLHPSILIFSFNTSNFESIF